MSAFATLLAVVLVMSHPTGSYRDLAGDLFNDADSDGNGALTYDEITAVLPSTSRDTFKQADANGDDVIDEDEFELGVEAGLFVER